MQGKKSNFSINLAIALFGIGIVILLFIISRTNNQIVPIDNTNTTTVNNIDN